MGKMVKKGDRVELVFINDTMTRLKPGSQGIVFDIDDNIFENDPAARSVFEVVLTYSGLHAIWSHRIAHWFFKRKLFFFARVISQVSRFLQESKFTLGQK